MYQQALDGFKKAVGPTLLFNDIPSLTTLESLADLYTELDRTGDVQLYYQRSQIGVEAIWGRES